MSWLFLFLAIVSEVTGTTCMKLSVGFTKFLPSLSMAIFYCLSLTSLTLAIKQIDISVAYAIWSGLGMVLIAIIGIFWFKEAISILKLLSIVLVIAGVVGLKISSNSY